MSSCNSFSARVLGKAGWGLVALVCTVWGLAESPVPAVAPMRAAAELPSHWHGRPVRPLALSAVEQRFAERFPGQIARLTDGRQIVVLRDVALPTRRLHPAADCYRALGYRIEHERLERMGEAGAAAVQRCFTARRQGVALRVCEQIEDAHGQRFADTSAWYWSALLGRSTGPWRAVTVTQALTGDQG